MTEADFFNVIQIVCQFFVYIEIDDVVSTVTPITLVNVNGCYNELVVAFFSTGGGVKGKKNLYLLTL